MMAATRQGDSGVRRRIILAAAASSTMVTSGYSVAQPTSRQYTVVILHQAAERLASRRVGFDEALREAGYVEGRNLTVQSRYWQGDRSSIARLATELVQMAPDVLIADGNLEIVEAQRATSRIPIVMVNAQDPVGAGFVASLARPGGNITGLSAVAGTAIRAKRLELLKEIDPSLSRVAVLREIGASSAPLSRELYAAARALGLTLEVVEIRFVGDLDRAFVEIQALRPGALYLDGASMLTAGRHQIAEFAIRHRLPTTFVGRDFITAGFLITYGYSIFDNWRRAADYVDKILKGAKPADLPVEQPSKFELLVNLRTARAIGVTIPRSILVRADEILD